MIDDVTARLSTIQRSIDRIQDALTRRSKAGDDIAPILRAKLQSMLLLASHDTSDKGAVRYHTLNEVYDVLWDMIVARSYPSSTDEATQ